MTTRPCDVIIDLIEWRQMGRCAGYLERQRALKTALWMAGVAWRGIFLSVDDCRAQRQSSSGSRVRRRIARTIASPASLSTVDRGSVGLVFISSTVARFRHFATVLGLMPSSRLSCASEACDHSGHPLNRWRAGPHYCNSDGVRGRGAPVTNLSHSASFQSSDRIAPSNRGIKHPSRGKSAGKPSAFQSLSGYIVVVSAIDIGPRTETS
jgi:hypothetical protein